MKAIASGVKAGIEVLRTGAGHRYAEMALKHRGAIGQHDGNGIAFTNATIF